MINICNGLRTRYPRNLRIFRSAVVFAGGVFLACPQCGDTDKDLVIGSGGECNYQVLIPVNHNDTLARAGGLIRDAFAANGFEVPVVTEDRDDAARPGIYLGDTQFARNAGMTPGQFSDWAYRIRVAGENLVITGSNRNGKFGVVKGVCDFLRDYAGTRFLYPGETGIGFLEMPVIRVPADMDLSVQPMLKFNFSTDMYPEEWLYNIANNHFQADLKIGGHSYHLAVPHEKYYATHPEYFALVDGKRLDRQRKSQYCISNPKVKERIIEYLVSRADMGHEILYIAQPDAFIPCECNECHALYGTGDNWDEKLWLFHREIAERIQQERPGVKFLILSYQVTIHPPKTFRKFPENTMVHLTHTYQEALDEWSGSGVEVPGGFVLVPRMFGSHFYTNFLPKMTPYWLEKRVRSFYETDLDVVGLKPMASIDCYGLEGPAYYVFGRMFDDPPNHTAEGLLEEFYTAAFREAADPMQRFYSILHEHYRFNSDWLAGRAPTQWTVVINGPRPVGVDDPLDLVGSRYARLYGSRGMKQRNTDPGQTLNMIFRPDMIPAMERELAEAEHLAASDKVKKRLGLVRMEFDYMRRVPVINHLYNAWRILPDNTTLSRLLEAVDSLNALLDSYYDGEGKMENIPGWPEILPFRATGRNALGLRTDRHWGRKKEYLENPFAWDTRTIRDSLHYQ